MVILALCMIYMEFQCHLARGQGIIGGHRSGGLGYDNHHGYRPEAYVTIIGVLPKISNGII